MAKRNPTYDATKPPAAELRAARNYFLDRAVRWAANTDYCDIVSEALDEVFGRQPVNGWRDSEGFDCFDRDINGIDRDGYDEDGYNKDGFDANGIQRSTGRTVEGYDRYGFDINGWNKDGYDSRGRHRDGVQHLLGIMTTEQKVEMKKALADFNPNVVPETRSFQWSGPLTF